jgi:hypothetical protein
MIEMLKLTLRLSLIVSADFSTFVRPMTTKRNEKSIRKPVATRKTTLTRNGLSPKVSDS